MKKVFIIPAWGNRLVGAENALQTKLEAALKDGSLYVEHMGVCSTIIDKTPMVEERGGKLVEVYRLTPPQLISEASKRVS